MAQVNDIERAEIRFERSAGVSWLDRNIRLLFILPCVIYILILGLFPLFFSLYLILNSWQPGTGKGLKFVGLRNLQKLSGDGRFWYALEITVLFVVIAVALELLLGFIIALVLQAPVKGKQGFRIAFTLPMLLTPIAISFTWRMLFDFNRGPVNFFLGLVGLPGVGWLGAKGGIGPITVPLLSVILVDIWQWTPFMALALLAALESQDVELYDAALVDGASFWGLLRYITLPLLSPFILAVVLLRSIDAFKVFDTVFVLTGGGPGSATDVVTHYAYSAHFRTFNMGYMATIAWVLVIIMIIIFMLFMRAFRRLETA